MRCKHKYSWTSSKWHAVKYIHSCHQSFIVLSPRPWKWQECAALRQINVDGRFLDYIMVCTIHIIGRRKRDESTTRIGWPLHRFWLTALLRDGPRDTFLCEFCIRHDFYVYVISSDGNDEIFNETFVFKFSIKYSDSLRLRINQQFSQNLCDIQFIHELLSETQFSPFYQSFLCAVLRNARQSFRYHFLFFWL